MDQTTPANEPGRLEALKNYAIVDTLPEAGFDEIAELAAQICECPAGLVSFVDASRQWIKAKYGPLPAELSECPREISVCRATVCVDDILHIPDLSLDQRFNTSPLVTDGLRHCATNGTLTADAWRLFQQRYPMPADQREAVLLATIQNLLRLTADIQAEANRLNHALSRRG